MRPTTSIPGFTIALLSLACLAPLHAQTEHKEEPKAPETNPDQKDEPKGKETGPKTKETTPKGKEGAKGGKEVPAKPTPGQPVKLGRRRRC